jgi:hypothetical protein
MPAGLDLAMRRIAGAAAAALLALTAPGAAAGATPRAPVDPSAALARALAATE